MKEADEILLRKSKEYFFEVFSTLGGLLARLKEELKGREEALAGSARCFAGARAYERECIEQIEALKEKKKE